MDGFRTDRWRVRLGISGHRAPRSWQLSWNRRRRRPAASCAAGDRQGSAGVCETSICFFFQAEDGIRDIGVTGVQTCALPIYFRRHHPREIDRASVTLADAQLVLARTYQAPNWPRLVLACRLIDAIWRDDIDTVRDLVLEHPQLLHQHAAIRDSNWGPPLSYAANLGRDRIIAMLRDLGATDLQHALGRATLQGKIGTARLLHAMLGAPRPPADALGGPAYTLSVSGTALML